ncbi:MAG: S8 family serine peptidase [Bdellovibrionaceae bacterium]|jgi:subtilisin family serine protease|nr:S8 family serine peptidase [Pseudobdellovibrionaceae bacterium]
MKINILVLFFIFFGLQSAANEYHPNALTVQSRHIISPVKYCTPDVNDPKFSMQWYLRNNGQLIKDELNDLVHYDLHGLIYPAPEDSQQQCVINQDKQSDADIGWRFVYKKIDALMKTDIVVAVIDRGADPKHPDLNYYKNEIECDEDEINPKATEDRDGNGFVGDCMGWNFTQEFAPTKKRPRRDRASRQREPRNSNARTRPPRENPEPTEPEKIYPGSNRIDDDHGHGTHVAGLIAAKKGNNKFITSLSNRIKVLPLRVNRSLSEANFKALRLARAKQQNTSKDLNPREEALLVEFSLEGSAQRIIKAINYAIDLKKPNSDENVVNVINLSLAWPRNAVSKATQDQLKAAIEKAIDQNIFIVVAAGNNRTNIKLDPCHIKGVLCVGSVDNSGYYSDFSNYGGQVNLLAPGQQILSLFPQLKSLWKNQLYNQTGLEIMSGTSQSAPITAAVVSAIKGIHYNKERNKHLSNAEVMAYLTRSTAPVKNKSESEVFYAKNGLLSLKGIDKPLTEENIEPIFKEILDLPLNLVTENSGTVSFPLAFKNFGIGTNDVKISISSPSENVTIEKHEFSFSQWDAFFELSVGVEILMNDLRSHKSIPIHVLVSSANRSKVFKHEIEAFLPLNELTTTQVSTVPIVKPTEVSVFFNKYNFKRPAGQILIKEIKPETPSTEFPDYYSVIQGTVTDDITTQSVYFFKKIAGKLSFVKKIELPNAYVYDDNPYYLQPKIQKLDLNFDGKNDYFISYLNIKLKENGSPDYARRYFYYLDHNLSPLDGPIQEGEAAKIPFLGQEINIQLYQNYKFSFIPHVFENTKVMIPILFQAHLIPDNKNKMTLDDLSILRPEESILIFKPKRDENNQVQFHMDYIFNQPFIKTLRLKVEAELKKNKRLKYGFLLDRQQVSPIQLLNQSPEQIKRNEFQIYLSISRHSLHFYCKELKNTLIMTFTPKSLEDNSYTVKYVNQRYNKMTLYPKCQNFRPSISLNKQSNKYMGKMGEHYFPQVEQNYIRGSVAYLSPDKQSYSHFLRSYTSDDNEHLLHRLDSFSITRKEIKETLYFESQAHDLGSFVKRPSANESHYYNFAQSFSEISLTKDKVLSDGSISSQRFYKPINLYSYDLLDIKNLQHFKSIRYQGSNNEFEPALIVDNSSLKKGHYFIWTYREDKLVAPIHLNIQAPKECLAMNPKPVNNDGVANMMFLCRQGENWNIKAIPIGD